MTLLCLLKLGLVASANSQQVLATPFIGASAHLAPAECAWWGSFYDSTGGTNWTRCRDNRADPCGCSAVTCRDGHITAL